MNDGQEGDEDLLLDYLRHPQFRGELPPPARSLELTNPLCGDRVCLFLDDSKGGLELTHRGKGCTISQASVEILCAELQGRRSDEALRCLNAFAAMIRSDPSVPLDEAQKSLLGAASVLQGIRAFPTRTKCALLGWEALGALLSR